MPQAPSFASLSLYAAGVLCVLGLFGLMRPSRLSFRAGATIIGLAGVGLLMAIAVQSGGGPDGPPAPAALCVAFATIAIAGAVRMITHPRPVFAALYFILVVLSSAALFLLMQAEFMAFALIIVYAGAILITYMFVLMLAQQGPEESVGRISRDDYDRIPREPAVAVVVGFFMLMVLSQTFLGPKGPMPDRGESAIRAVEEGRLAIIDRSPRMVLEAVRRVEPDAIEVLRPGEGQPLVRLTDDGRYQVLAAVRRAPDVVSKVLVTLDDLAVLTNTREVGFSLVSEFPVSLELAGVILLMAMFGAVVLARRQIELGEDERREAAGLRRLSPEEPSESDGSGGGAWSGDRS